VNICCAYHLVPMLNPKQARYTVKQVIKMIRTMGLRFDAIACRGVSGLLIAPGVALRLNKTLLKVRKKKEEAHSSFLVEGDRGAKRYIILDDFIESGDTVKEIAKAIHKVNPTAHCVGYIAYKRLSELPRTFCKEPFKKEMTRAWWDAEKAPERFFPKGVYEPMEV